MSPRNAAALRDSPGRSLRDHLIATAAEMIAELGTADLTVRAIARAAGVADGVLYNHFADKEELLAHALLAYVRRVEGGLGVLPAPGEGTLRDGLRAYVLYGMALHDAVLPAFASLLGRRQVLARFADLSGPDHWRDRLLDYLRAERALGRLTPDADIEAATTMIVGACHEPVIATMFSTPPPHPPNAPADPSDATAHHAAPRRSSGEAADALVATILAGIAR
ncbi:MAG: TetR family transcriptional regulator [Streptosporangiales bacterium]|nr:TetR family transcriptional regulator [Streptosporangiales bacterium]